MKDTDQGFTLLELVVVMALVAIVAAASLNFATSRRVLSDLDRAANDIATHLRQAKSRSITSNRQAMVSIDLAGRTISVDGTLTGEMIAKSIAIQTSSLRPDPGQQVARYIFFAEGSTTGGEIVLSLGGDTRRIEVHWLTGVVTLKALP